MWANKFFLGVVSLILGTLVGGCSQKSSVYIGEINLAGENVSQIRVEVPPQDGGLPWRFRFSGDPSLSERKEGLAVHIRNLGESAVNFTPVGRGTELLAAAAEATLFEGSLGSLYTAGRGSLAEPEIYTPRENSKMLLIFKPKENIPRTKIKIYLVRNFRGL